MVYAAATIKEPELTLFAAPFWPTLHLRSLQVVGADGGAQAAVNLIPHAYLYVFEKIQPAVGA